MAGGPSGGRKNEPGNTTTLRLSWCTFHQPKELFVAAFQFLVKVDKHTRFHLSGLFANSYNFGSDTPSSVKVPRKEVRKTTSQTLGWERGKRREAGMAGGGWAGLSLSGVSAWPSQGDDED